MAKRSEQAVEKIVNPTLVAEALAKAVCEGDVVNFRLLFSAFSPTRKSSGEAFEGEKYQYLLPNEEQRSDARFVEALDLVQAEATWTHIEGELEVERPAQLPSELLLVLADNAVRGGKYTVAAQAYELLRIRNKMQNAFLDQADTALQAGEIAKGVRGYLIATGLSYDYAAFPEPLPAVPEYQTKALMLHAIYPARPEDCVAVQKEETHLTTALEFLIQDEEIAGRLRAYPLETQLDFLKELVSQIDPEWNAFTERYAEACELTLGHGKRLRQSREPHVETLEEEIEEQQGADPLEIMAKLLGRTIENGEWWQYLKELGYEHPAAVLFVARQLVGEHEIIMPRILADSAVPAALGLTEPAVADTTRRA